ncbi:unnamed protein product [Urochloa decumbens]|uniref:Uncharacterized protein n=1 Tax=Urochloa decumbens TaxID=240449 RepID=A0ABC9DWL0_9POAL
MSRSFAGDMKRHWQRALKPQITGSFLCCNTVLCPTTPLWLCDIPQPSKCRRPGDGTSIREARKPHAPRLHLHHLAPSQHARRRLGEVKRVSLNSCELHAVPSDCSFPGLTLTLPLPAVLRFALCVVLLASCCSLQRAAVDMAGRSGRLRLPMNSRPAI